jgi:hypothetical protein
MLPPVIVNVLPSVKVTPPVVTLRVPLKFEMDDVSVVLARAAMVTVVSIVPVPDRFAVPRTPRTTDAGALPAGFVPVIPPLVIVNEPILKLPFTFTVSPVPIVALSVAMVGNVPPPGTEDQLAELFQRKFPPPFVQVYACCANNEKEEKRKNTRKICLFSNFTNLFSLRNKYSTTPAWTPTGDPDPSSICSAPTRKAPYQAAAR